MATHDKTTSVVFAAGGAVALFAATVSYTHIYGLARSVGQPVACAALYPLLTDGLIVASTLCLNSAKRTKAITWPSRLALYTGVGATLAANVSQGLHHGPAGAVVAGWPALAFFISAELVLWMFARSAAPVAARRTVQAAQVAPVRAHTQPAVHTHTAHTQPEGASTPAQAKQPATQLSAPPGGKVNKTDAARELYMSILASGEDISGKKLAELVGVTPTIGNRVIRELRPVPDDQPAQNGHASQNGDSP